jgi:hypothetical protein
VVEQNRSDLVEHVDERFSKWPEFSVEGHPMLDTSLGRKGAQCPPAKRVALEIVEMPCETFEASERDA